MKKNKFIIVTPTYNSETYMKQCIDSVLSQDYGNYEFIIIDDCSTDKTFNIISDAHSESPTFQYIRNNVRLGSAVGNIIKGISKASKSDEDIIIVVDGDDWLNGTDVLSYLNELYQDEQIYMTYGQYEPLSHSYHNYCRPISNFRTYRKSGLWYASHLRTFKRKIWNIIKDDDLRNSDGGYYKIGSDAAWLYPLLEICGENHAKFIEKILYVYNDLNPINDMKVHVDEQIKTAKEIRNKKEYNEIK